MKKLIKLAERAELRGRARSIERHINYLSGKMVHLQGDPQSAESKASIRQNWKQTTALIESLVDIEFELGNQ